MALENIPLENRPHAELIPVLASENSTGTYVLVAAVAGKRIVVHSLVFDRVGGAPLNIVLLSDVNQIIKVKTLAAMDDYKIKREEFVMSNVGESLEFSISGNLQTDVRLLYHLI